MKRRSEFARLRKQQTQQRRLNSEQAETSRQKKIADQAERFANQLQAFIDDLPDSDSSDGNYKEWNPYFSSPETGFFKRTLKGASWAVEKLALQAALSVVRLQSCTGKKETYLFSCSGTVVESVEGSSMIVTVANLVKCPDTDGVAKELKVYVHLQNRETFIGNLVNHDFYHNICVIEIQSNVHLPAKNFSSSTEAMKFDKRHPRDVVTLGRDQETNALLVNVGKIIPKFSDLDCEDLLVSNCKISKVEVGGPLMDFNGNFIGMNYYHAEETPFIPSFIVLKCLQQFKLFRRVVRPLHGMRVRTLYSKESTNSCGSTAVIVEKIGELPSQGLSEGDIINQVNGKYFCNAAELGGILLDMGTAYLLDYNTWHIDEPIVLKFCVRGRGLEGIIWPDSERLLFADKSTTGGLDRWPFPKPIILQHYADGILRYEEFMSP